VDNTGSLMLEDCAGCDGVKSIFKTGPIAFI